jgi:hypothetical protein
MIASPELLAARAIEAEEVRAKAAAVIAELHAIGLRKAAAWTRSHHKPLRDVSMSRERLALAYRQAGLKPPGQPA